MPGIGRGPRGRGTERRLGNPHLTLTSGSVSCIFVCMIIAPSATMPTPHVVLLLDFLGFTNEVMSRDRARVAEMARLLLWLAETQSVFEVCGEGQIDGGYRIDTNANVTTFSDLVVMSYPCVVHESKGLTEEKIKLLRELWYDVALQHMQEFVAVTALQALELGLLLRGGIALGDLVHHDRVVIGEALIKAHHLENCIAVTARIVVADEFLVKIPERIRSTRLSIDTDGLSHLNYFTVMGQRIVRDRGQEAAQNWRETSLARVADTERALSVEGKLQAAKKWGAFQTQLAQATMDLRNSTVKS